MRILFVSMTPFDYNASAVIQNKGIVKGLAASGNVVDTLTLAPIRGSIRYDGSMNDIASLIENGHYIELDQKYKRLSAKSGNTVSGDDLITSILRSGRLMIKRVYDSVAIFDAQSSNVKNVSKVHIDYSKYDAIISSSDPKSSHLIAKEILRREKSFKGKWIQYWGDPMFHDITRKSDWRNRIVKYHERKLISSADRVIYASPLSDLVN